MVNEQTSEMEQLDSPVNDRRSNIISLLSRVYKVFEAKYTVQEYTFENYKVIFMNGTLEIKGCIDEIIVSGRKYSDVVLGDKIRNHGHFPYHWIASFCD